MSRECPKCCLRSPVKIHGVFVRRSDKRRLLRFRCLVCKLTFSQATKQACYRQKKRRLNPRIFELLASGNSQRRIALLLKINRKTVARKLVFLAKEARVKNQKTFLGIKSQDLDQIQFDDLETFEHTKCKPLSVTMAVQKKTRQILLFSVSQMPAKGHLATISFKKYGPRKDYRSQARESVFKRLAIKLPYGAIIESDDNPHYKVQLKELIPHAIHKTHLGKRGAITGQGEIKKIFRDPLFALNHTFAMFRDNIGRLARKTWCTTKRPDRLRDHLEIYTYYHNHFLLNHPAR